MTSQNKKSVIKSNLDNHHSINQLNSKFSNKDNSDGNDNKILNIRKDINSENYEDKSTSPADEVDTVQETTDFNNVKVKIENKVNNNELDNNSITNLTTINVDSTYDPAPNDIDFHCDYCKTPLPIGRIRIHCVECQDYDLCVECLSKGNVNNGHLLTHKYTPIGPNKFSLFSDKWNADEEIILLEGISKYGFGNWKQISEMITSMIGLVGCVKTPEECELHYRDVYLRGKFAPFPDLNDIERLKTVNEKRGARIVLSDDIKGKINEYIDESNNSGYDIRSEVGERALSHPDYLPEYWEPNLANLSEAIANTSSSNMSTTIHGIQPFRRELEEEYDNDAELLIRDLDFDPDDTPSEIELKLQLVDLYNSRLDERIYRKHIILHKAFPLESSVMSYQLFKGNWCESIRLTGRSFSDDNEAKISNELSPFFRFQHKVEYLRMIKLMVIREEVLKRINMLKEWSKLGLYSIDEIRKFEQRTNDFGTANKSNRRYFKKSSQSGIIIDNQPITLDLNPVFKTDFKLNDKQLKDLFKAVSIVASNGLNKESQLEPVCNVSLQMVVKDARNDYTNCFIAKPRIAGSEYIKLIEPILKDLPNCPGQYILLNKTNEFNEEKVTSIGNKYTNKMNEKLKSMNRSVFEELGLGVKQELDVSLIKANEYKDGKVIVYQLKPIDNNNETSTSTSGRRKRTVKSPELSNEFFKNIQSIVQIRNDIPNVYYKAERASWVVETSDLPGSYGKLRKILFPIHKLGFEYAYFCAIQRRVKILWECYIINNLNPIINENILFIFEHYTTWCKAIKAANIKIPGCTIINSKLSSQVMLLITKGDYG